jgi:hypothetical protein
MRRYVVRRALRASLALRTPPCEMCRGAPGMMPKRRKASHRVYACHRFTRSQLSVRRRAQRRAAVGTLRIVQFFCTMLQPDNSRSGQSQRRGARVKGTGRLRQLGLQGRRVAASTAGPNARCFKSSLFAGRLGEPRRVVESVQRAREPPLVTLRFERAVHTRYKFLCLA